MRHFVFTLIGINFASLLYAQEAERNALRLADQQQSEVSVPDSPTRISVEVGIMEQHHATGKNTGVDTSVDLFTQQQLNQDINFVFSDRFDYNSRPSYPATTEGVNTLREMYGDWHLTATTGIQIGRINSRQGVALGYNPTDVFRAYAVRSKTSLDPEALRTNRQGVFSGLAQKLWDSGAMTVQYAPQLNKTRSDSPFSVNTGATNAHERYLLTLSQEVFPSFKPQFLLYQEHPGQLQFGVNATTLLGQKTIFYFEGLSGKDRSIVANALNLPEERKNYNRVAAGLTYTTEQKLSLTVEYVRNGTGLNRQGWSQLPSRVGVPAITQILQYASDTLDPPSKHNLFLHLRWKDMGISNLDFLAFMRRSQADPSRQYWGELRYHYTQSDLGIQYERNRGLIGSVYGSVERDYAWRVFYRCFF